jgi:hypothetical protein
VGGTQGSGGATGVGGGAGGATGIGGAAVGDGGFSGDGNIGYGGTAGGGGSAGVGGSNGIGGALPDLCSMAWDPGNCRGLVEAWWHDPSTGVCMPVNYSGCGGNANRFSSRAECQAGCRGHIPPNMDSCMVPTDCALIAPGCCGGCEPLNDRSFISVNQPSYSFFAAKCAGVSCAACPPLPAGVYATGRYFVPGCENGECTVVDIRQTPLTECQTSDDCYLRMGAHCCELCGGEGVVALNRRASLSPLICGSTPVACPTCASIIPPGFTASCNAGRCVVNEPPCTMTHPCTL